MNSSESYVFDLLRKHSSKGEWKFFEANGKNKAQSKKYPSLNYWVAYPDFEYYCDDKLLLLVEVKGYTDFFDNVNNVVAVKLKHFLNYREVMNKEKINIRICFIIKYGSKKLVFWENLENISKFPYSIKMRTYTEFDYEIDDEVEKTEKFIYWNVANFRTDEENLPRITQ
jgi:hypothetical protein